MKRKIYKFIRVKSCGVVELQRSEVKNTHFTPALLLRSLYTSINTVHLLLIENQPAATNCLTI